jgi:hypothetical protein
MPKRCAYVHPNGKPCRRWPMEDHKYCYHHAPSVDATQPDTADELHPLLRLTTPGDVFDVVRETLNAARLGRIKPSQVYAVGYMAQLWARFYDMQRYADRWAGLYRQFNPDLVDEEEVADDARAPVTELAEATDRAAKPEVVPAAKSSTKKSA